MVLLNIHLGTRISLSFLEKLKQYRGNKNYPTPPQLFDIKRMSEDINCLIDGTFHRAHT